MMRLVGTSLAVALVMGLAAVANAAPLTFTKSDLQASLSGKSIKAKKALSANVEVQIESPTSALLRVTNTSPAGGGEARLRRFGFQLKDGPQAKCLSLEAPGTGFKLKKVARPFCFWASWGTTCWDDTKEPKKVPWKQAWKESLFSYNVHVKSPVKKHGIAEGASALVRIKVAPSCAGSFKFTKDSFLLAPHAKSVGQSGNWAAKFKIFNGKKKDRGCAVGVAGVPAPPPPPPPPACDPEFTWGDLVATTADLTGQASAFLPVDTRAGSAQVMVNGGVGFGGPWTDAPYEAITATLRNGAGVIVEQLQANRRWPPPLDADGCNPTRDYPECWSWWDAAVDGLLALALPTWSDGSNAGFDDGPLRPTVTAQILSEDVGEPDDNAHQTVVVQWHAPLGLENAQLLLRARYDASLDGSFNDEPFVTLLSLNIGAEDVFSPDLLVEISEDLTTLTATFSVQAGLEAVCRDYEGL